MEGISAPKRVKRMIGLDSAKANDPKDFVRTNSAAQPGALEPYLVKSQSMISSAQRKGNKALKSLYKEIIHEEGCEFASRTTTIDMSVPGAFASICRCQVARSNELPPLWVSPEKRTIAKPKVAAPTECSYTSIQTLRANILSQAHSDLTSKLRNSVFVGCISEKRSLIQSGIELIMLNHLELSRELYYQLATNGFGGFQAATIGDLNVKSLLQQAILLDCSNSPNDADNSLLEKATQTLHENGKKQLYYLHYSKKILTFSLIQADMLKTYFSICFEKKERKSPKESDILVLKQLPILLEGQVPSPHGLPNFLLRLATTVNMKEEFSCFEGVCNEIGTFYANIQSELIRDDDVISSKNDELQKYVRHTRFPGLKYLLMAPEKFTSHGSFCILTKLSAVFKVFERC